VRRLAFLLVWFLLLEGLWAILVGTRQTTELVAGLIAAAVGAAFALVLQSLGVFGYETDWHLLARAWHLIWQTVFDFAVVTWVLAASVARRRRVRGEWVLVPFPTDGGARGRWQRAFGSVAGTATPNAIVVDLRRDEGLLHALAPGVRTARQVVER
jgi:multisubunit Na+/H+ antiporter MnhE subunit